jgi:hypothetical protein
MSETTTLSDGEHVTPGEESGTDFSQSGLDQRRRTNIDALAGMRRPRNGPSFAQTYQIRREGGGAQSRR